MNHFIKAIGLLVFLIGVQSCTYNVPKQEVLPPIEEDLSFSTDIEPIFEAQTCTNCHNSGNSLNLLPGEAYASIFANQLVLNDDAENSRIYFYPLETGSHFKKYTAEQAQFVLTWIQQGAQDN